MIDAFNVQKVAGGRPLFEFPKLTRRVNWSEQIVNQRRRMLNKNLVDMKSEHKII